MSVDMFMNNPFTLNHVSKETIILAAIKTGDNNIAVMPKPFRHCDIINHLARNGSSTQVKGLQGFLTSEGRFVDRAKALGIAKRAGQIKETPYFQLYTEDLW